MCDLVNQFLCCVVVVFVEWVKGVLVGVVQCQVFDELWFFQFLQVVFFGNGGIELFGCVFDEGGLSEGVVVFVDVDCFGFVGLFVYVLKNVCVDGFQVFQVEFVGDGFFVQFFDVQFGLFVFEVMQCCVIVDVGDVVKNLCVWVGVWVGKFMWYW